MGDRVAVERRASGGSISSGPLPSDIRRGGDRSPGAVTLEADALRISERYVAEMRKAVFGLPTADVVLAVGLMSVRFLALGTGLQSGSWVSILVTPLWTLPLAWRRTRPLAVTSVVMGTSVLEIAVSGYHDSVVALAAYLLLPYSLAANAATLRRMA